MIMVSGDVSMTSLCKALVVFRIRGSMCVLPRLQILKKRSDPREPDLEVYSRFRFWVQGLG